MFWQTAYASTVGLPQASAYAAKVDGLHDFLWYISIFFLFLVTAAAIIMVVKYHRSQKGRQTAYILGSHSLEAAWTIGPLVLMLFIFAWGYRDYLEYRKVPSNPVEINVVGRQWLWNIEYPNGRKTMNELYIPKGRAIKLVITSEDVLHSVFLPHMRAKQDAVPGMYTYMQFTPTMVGTHPMYCTEYCGTAHSDMLGTVYVLEEADYNDWLNTGKLRPGALPADAKKVSGELVSGGGITSGSPGANTQAVVQNPADKGKALFNSKGCFACHTDDGTRKIGPSFKGVWGHEVDLEGGRKAVVDENYVRKSLTEPQADIVAGYPASMPTFKGLLSDEEINSLIAYIKSLK